MGDVRCGGRARGLPAGTVRRVVHAVLAGERADADVSVSFIGAASMRRLNQRHKGHDRPTDVIAFALSHPDARLLGDIYVCPSVARASAARHATSARRELVRLVVHGMLHVLGHDHPDGEGRVQSDMWRRQERYVRRLT